MSRQLEFDETSFLSLKREYEKAVNEGREQFTLPDGTILLTSYAKYLIEYLSLHLMKGGKT